MVNAKVSGDYAVPIVAGTPRAKVSGEFISPVVIGTPNARVSGEFISPVVIGTPNARVSGLFVAPIVPIPVQLPTPSLLVYPELPGLTYSAYKRPKWNPLVQTHATGRELRLGQADTPLYEWELNYSVLRTYREFRELQTLQGFFQAVQGPRLGFLYRDPDDFQVSNQLLGTVTSGASTLPLVRTLGARGFTETSPIGWLNPDFPLNVRFNGLLINPTPGNGLPGYILNNSVPGYLTITLTNVVQTGTVTADMTYFWYVRFKDTQLELQKFFSGYFEAQKVTLEQLRSEFVLNSSI